MRQLDIRGKLRETTRALLNALWAAVEPLLQTACQGFVDRALILARFFNRQLTELIEVAQTPGWVESRWQRHKSNWPEKVGWISGVIILAAVILVVLRFGDLNQFLKLATNVQLGWLLAALLLQAATYACAAAVWYVALKKAGEYRPLAQLAPLGVAKLFIDQTFPTGGVSGTVMVMGGLARRRVSLSAATSALLVSLVSYYTAFLLVVLLSLAVLAFYHAINIWILLVTIVFSVVAVGIPAGVLWLKDYFRKPIIARFRWVSGLTPLLETIAQAPTKLLRDPIVMGQTVSFQVLIFVLDSGTLWLMLHAIGQDTGLSVAFPSYVISGVVATLGPIPLGFGTFEGVSVAMLRLLGTPLEAALTATLLLRGFTVWLPMLPGIWLARREFARSASETSEHLPDKPSP